MVNRVARSLGASGHAATSRRAWASWHAALLLLAGCSLLGPPPMEPLTAENLAVARERWAAHGVDTYRVVVRVRPPRAAVELWEVEVSGGAIVKLARDGHALGPGDPGRADYSVTGIFDLLRTDLRWTTVEAVGDVPAIDLRAEFDHETGRLVRYRRTVGTSKRRVLLVEVLAFEPVPSLHAAAAARP